MKSTRLNLAWGTNELPELQPHWEKWFARAQEQDIYQPAGFFGVPDLKKAIAERFHYRYKAQVNPKQVTITNGGTEALYTIFQWLKSIKGQVVLQEPAWGYFHEALELLEIPIISSVAMEANELKEELEAFDVHRPTLFLLTQPSNPLCQVFDRNYLSVLSNWVKSNEQQFVLSDEIYDWYVRPEDEFHSWTAVHGMENSFIVHGYSKPTGLASWRVGYFIAPSSHLRALNSYHMNTTYGTSSMSQFMALEAQKEEEDIRKLLHHAIEKRRQLVNNKWEQHEDIKLLNDGVGMYSYITLPWNREKQEAFFKMLREEGEVMITPGYSFGIKTGGMRLNLTRSIAQLEEAIEIIIKFLERT